MDCPVCHDPLEEIEQTAGLFLDYCSICGGAWFDAGEVAKLGERLPGFAAAIERAMKTLTPTPRACCRCAQPLQRAWIAEAQLEIDVCSACKGSWLDRSRFQSLRSCIYQRTGSRPAPPPAGGPLIKAPAVIGAIAAAVFLLSTRAARTRSEAARQPPPAASPEGLKTSREYEHDALFRAAEGKAAESHDDREGALDGYYTASGLYYLAIRAAKTPPEIWRLDEDYARLGARIAALELRQGRPTEAEKVQLVRLAVFERHRSLAGQADAWQGLAAASEAAGRRDEAAQRREKAASLARAASF